MNLFGKSHNAGKSTHKYLVFHVVSSSPLEVWVATDDRRILLYAAADPENGCEVGRIMLPAAPLCQVIDYHHKTLYYVISSPYHATTLPCVTIIPNVSDLSQFFSSTETLPLPGAPLWQGVCGFGQRSSTNLQERPHCQLGPQ